ncbi:MAG: sensor histidine kinase, partial [Actinomycetota bacterium]
VEPAFLKRIRGGGDAELMLLLGGQVTATSGGDQRAAGAAFARSEIASRIRRTVEEERDTLGTGVEIGGSRAFCAFVPLRRAGGEVVSVLASCATQAGVRASQESLNRVLFLIALAAAAIAAAIASAAGGRVARPIRRLTLAAEAIRLGDLSARAEASSPDELGALALAFNQMAASLDRSTADLRAAAGTEAELRERMEAIMQSMDDGLMATDPKGRIVTSNLAAERLTGVPVADMTGRSLGEVVRGTDAIGRDIAEVALASGAAAATLETAAGDSVPVAITSTPLRAGGEEAGRVVVLRDISAEVQAEKMKSEFLSNVSHELRTPLTPIKGYTEILKRKKFPKEKAESFLDGILESTARLERIVEILVDFAALEAGRLKPRTEPVHLKPFVARLVGRWKERTTGRFTIKVPLTLPAVDADPRLLTKVVDELIDNAVKFSPNGPRVEIEATAVHNGSRSRRPAAVRLAVRDRGIGIAEDKMPSLFRDFQQLDGSETREFGGLGLGLAYVKRVAA